MEKGIGIDNKTLRIITLVTIFLVIIASFVLIGRNAYFYGGYVACRNTYEPNKYILNKEFMQCEELKTMKMKFDGVKLNEPKFDT